MQTEFRAIVQSEYGAPEKVLRIAKRQLKSEELGADDVLVKVIARPIHHGDIHILSALPQGGPVAPIPADVGNLSTSQLVTALAPGARVVKAFNHMTDPNLEGDPVVNGARRVAFVSADNDEAKKRVDVLLKELGYSVIDLGNLRDGGLIQQAGGPLAGRDLWERGEYHK
jgi:hypothetical protein